MTIDAQTKIDIMAKKDNLITLVIAEHRPWKDIEDAEGKLLFKIFNYKNYIRSREIEELGKKPRENKFEIIMDSKYSPPKNIMKILKREGINLFVNHNMK